MNKLFEEQIHVKDAQISSKPVFPYCAFITWKIINRMGKRISKYIIDSSFIKSNTVKETF